MDGNAVWLHRGSITPVGNPAAGMEFGGNAGIKGVGHLDSRDFIILASSVSQALLILGRFKLTCLVFGVYSSPHV